MRFGVPRGLAERFIQLHSRSLDLVCIRIFKQILTHASESRWEWRPQLTPRTSPELSLLYISPSVSRFKILASLCWKERNGQEKKWTGLGKLWIVSNWREDDERREEKRKKIMKRKQASLIDGQIDRHTQLEIQAYRHTDECWSVKRGRDKCMRGRESRRGEVRVRGRRWMLSFLCCYYFFLFFDPR